MQKKVAILGASGYSGEELVRLLLRHPRVELACVTSRQNSGRTLAEVFPKFTVHSAILASLGPNRRSSVVFLALPHGVSSEWAVPLWKEGVRMIDLSADFRLED